MSATTLASPTAIPSSPVREWEELPESSSTRQGANERVYVESMTDSTFLQHPEAIRKYIEMRQRIHPALRIAVPETGLSLTYEFAAGIDLLSDYEAFCHPDWDGEGAKAIETKTLRTARDAIRFLSVLFPLPDVAPSTDGTIGFEWWRDESCIFIDFGPGDEITTYISLDDGNPSEEGRFRWSQAGSKERLKQLLARLFGSRDIGGSVSSHTWAESWWRPTEFPPMIKPVMMIGGLDNSPLTITLQAMEGSTIRHLREKYLAYEPEIHISGKANFPGAFFHAVEADQT